MGGLLSPLHADRYHNISAMKYVWLNIFKVKSPVVKSALTEHAKNESKFITFKLCYLKVGGFFRLEFAALFKGSRLDLEKAEEWGKIPRLVSSSTSENKDQKSRR